jgi:hypothetical protein
LASMVAGRLCPDANKERCRDAAQFLDANRRARNRQTVSSGHKPNRAPLPVGPGATPG